MQQEGQRGVLIGTWESFVNEKILQVGRAKSDDATLPGQNISKTPQVQTNRERYFDTGNSKHGETEPA
jgi:hypothetical protein